MNVIPIPTSIQSMAAELNSIRSVINTSPLRSELTQMRVRVKALAEACRANRESACIKPGNSGGSAGGAVTGGVIGTALGGFIGAAIGAAIGGWIGSNFNEQPRTEISEEAKKWHDQLIETAILYDRIWSIEQQTSYSLIEKMKRLMITHDEYPYDSTYKERITNWRGVSDLLCGKFLSVAGGKRHDAISLAVASLTHILEDVRKQARTYLSTLKLADDINAIVSLWDTSRNADIRQIIIQSKYVANTPLRLKIVSQLLTSQLSAGTIVGAETINILIECLSDDDYTISNQAASVIELFREPAAINHICQTWAQNRSPQIEAIITKERFLPSNPLELHVLCALKLKCLTKITEKGPYVVPYVRTALNDRDPDIANSANEVLRLLTDSQSDKNAEKTRGKLLEPALRHGGLPNSAFLSPKTDNNTRKDNLVPNITHPVSPIHSEKRREDPQHSPVIQLDHATRNSSGLEMSSTPESTSAAIKSESSYIDTSTITETEMSKEEKYLSRVLDCINTELNERNTEKDRWKRERQTAISEGDTSYFTDFNFSNSRQWQLSNTSERIEFLHDLLSSPYHGRVDFVEEKSGRLQKFYFGRHSILDNSTSESLVIDWRAQVYTLFGYELGPASYSTEQSSPTVLHGEIELKRHYVIDNSSLISMRQVGHDYESTDDEILVAILQNGTTDKMRQIVRSIQKEQSDAIRDKSKYLIIQGPAGSGKTSISLHRAAFILYQMRCTNSSTAAKNMLVLSPNRIFSDYIANVLPELGENAITQLVLDKAAIKELKSQIQNIYRYAIEEKYELYEYIFSGNDDDEFICRSSIIQLKSSYDMINILDDFVYEYYKASIQEIIDIAISRRREGSFIITKEELQEVLLKGRHGTLGERLFNSINFLVNKYLIDYLGDLLYRNKVTNKNGKIVTSREENTPEINNANELLYSKIRSHIEKHTGLIVPVQRSNNFEFVSKYDVISMYMKVFGNVLKQNNGSHNYDLVEKAMRMTNENLEKRMIRYEDIYPLLYLNGLLHSFKSMTDVKHIIIDEAQDYSPIEYAFISRIISDDCELTIVGDIDQSINPYWNIGDYTKIQKVMGKKFYNRLLSKSYRSTSEIIDIARNVLGGHVDFENVQRSGDKPVIVNVEDGADIFDVVLFNIHELITLSIPTIAVICKTVADANTVYQQLTGRVDSIKLIANGDQHFEKGVVVIPSYLAKGLEFDAVIVFDASEIKYPHESDRRILYTICSRALHRLVIIAKGKESPLFSKGAAKHPILDTNRILVDEITDSVEAVEDNSPIATPKQLSSESIKPHNHARRCSVCGKAAQEHSLVNGRCTYCRSQGKY